MLYMLTHNANDVKTHIQCHLVDADEGIGRKSQMTHLGARDGTKGRQESADLPCLDLYKNQRTAILGHDVYLLATMVVPVAGHDAIPFINKVLGGLVFPLLSGNVMLCHDVIQFPGDKSTKIYPLLQIIGVKTLPCKVTLFAPVG